MERKIDQIKKLRPHYARLSEDQIVDLVRESDYPDRSREEIAKALGVQIAAPVAPEQESRSVGRVAGDLGLGLTSGAISGVKMISDVFGADNPVSEGLGEANEYVQQFLSAQAKADQQEQARILREAEGKGVLEQVKAGVKAFATAPAQTVAQGLGSAAPTLAAALIPGAGPMAAAARIGAGVTLGTAQGVGAAKGAIYEEVKRKALERGDDELAAESLAAAAQAYDGPNAAQIALSGGLGALAAVTGAEGAVRALRGGATATQATRGLAARVGMGAVTEAIPEAAQGGQEKFATNTALNNAGFDQVDPWSGVAANATLEGLAAAPIGGAFAVPSPRLPDAGPLSRGVNAGLDAVEKSSGNVATRSDAAPAEPAIDAPGLTEDQYNRGMDAVMAQGEEDAKAMKLAGMRDNSPPRTVSPAADGLAGFAPEVPADVGEVDALADRILVTRQSLADEETRELIRSNMGDEALREAMYYVQQADMAKDIPDITRERMLGVAEEIVSRARLTPMESRTGGGTVNFAPTTEGLTGPAARPQIGLDMTPTGVLRADASGNVAPETNADRISTRQATQSREGDDRQARRASAVPADEAPRIPGKPKAIGYDTAPTGRMIAGETGVMVETEAERINRENARKVQPGDRMNPSGKPFKNKRAAVMEQARAGGAVVEVEGGWVVRQQAEDADGRIGEAAGMPEQPGAGGAPEAVGSMGGDGRGLADGRDAVADRGGDGAGVPGDGKRSDGAVPDRATGRDGGDALSGKMPAFLKAKTVPEMTDEELKQAQAFYGPNHKRAKTIQKEMAKRESKPILSGEPKSGRQGYEEPVTLDASRLKTLLERGGEPLVTKPAKLQAWRDGTAAKAGNIELAYRDKDGELAVNDGRHRIAHAAEQGKSVTVYISKADAKRLADDVESLNRAPKVPAVDEPKPSAPAADQARRPQQGEPGYTLEMAEQDLDAMRSNTGERGGILDDRVTDRIKRQEKLIAEMRAEAEPKKGAHGAPDQAIKPETLAEALQGLEDGKRVILYAGTDFEQEVWLDRSKTGARDTYVFKTRDKGSSVVITKGPVGADRQWGWGRGDAAREALKGVTFANFKTGPVEDDLAADPEMAAYERGQTAQTRAEDRKKVADAAKPSANTIFTEDAAAKAREILRKKLGQMNSGLDPEMMQAGITLAGYHIEKGARTFAAYTKAMLEDLGDTVRPYLKSWYMGVKYDPRAAGLDGMSTAAEVESADITAPTNTPVDQAAEPAQTADARPQLSVNGPEGRVAIAKSVADHMIGGNKFATIVDARKFIQELTGQKIEAGTALAKLADETIEMGVVMAARDMVNAGRRSGRSDEVIFDRLMGLYDAQPNLSVRTSTSVREQAYSTPIPLAFVASRLAGVTPDMRVGEPTAGNSALVLEVRTENAVVNELNKDRADNLKAMGFDPSRNNAATNDLAPAKTLDSVIMNPPFGAVKDESGESVVFKVLDGYDTREIDHAIALRALDAMKDDGTAVLIVGGIDAKDDKQIREGYRGKAKRQFYYHLYSKYGVVDHFTVEGGLYTKQGAGWPVDVIVIRGRGVPSSRQVPAAQLPQRLSNWQQVKEKIREANSLESTKPVSRPDAGSNPPAAPWAGQDGDGIPVVGSAGRQAGVADSTGVKPQGGRVVGREGAGSGGPVASQGDAERVGNSQRGPRTEGGAAPTDGRGSVPDAVRDDASPAQADGPDGRRNGPSGVGSQRDGAAKPKQPGLSDRRGQEEATETQSPYNPKSRGNSVGTLVPVNMRQSISDALDRLSDKVGDIDAYVAKSLDYSTDELAANFSAEQIDALALSIHNAESGKGFIIGDQTGIGKGRVVAGMIRFALRSGRTPIFVTEKPNLYADMIRDLNDIGMGEELGLLGANQQILMTNSNEQIPYEITQMGDDGPEQLTFTLKPARGLNSILEKLAEGGASEMTGYRVIFTTYSQLQTVKGKETERMRAMKALAPDSYLICDESHNAGGNSGAQARTKSQRNAAKEGESTATGRAAFLRQIVAVSNGSFFSSATYAKRPDVMDLYSSTNMMLAVNSPSELGPAIKEGGVPLQQVVANMLTKDGQYIRRERTFAGVTYETKPYPIDRETAENMATAMRKILEFSRAKQAVIKEMQATLDASSGIAMDNMGVKTTVEGANFGAIMHNLIDQMLLALKAKGAVDSAIASLKSNEKVVITVSNTMGSFLKDYADTMGVRQGEPVSLTFSDLYLRYLQKQRKITIKDAGGVKTDHILTDEQLGPELVDMYDKIQDFIEKAGFGDAPISPIDYMHARLREAGYKTDEITGRGLILSYDGVKKAGDLPSLASRNNSIKTRLAAIRGFNDGSLDVLILNQSGSTGLSLHASEKFKDQRKRRMIVAQAEKNIDTHMQMLGRVHRTGQVVVPSYEQATADIPAENRPAAILAKKMAMLNANTTASRKSAVSADGVVDFMNDYGGQVAAEFLLDNPEIHEAMGGQDAVEVSSDPEKNDEDLIRRVTGYIPVLPIKMQEDAYAEITRRYNELIERENAMGTNKLEARALDLDAKTISAETISTSKDEDSAFAAPAVMEKVDVRRTVKPMTKTEIAEATQAALKGKTSKAHNEDLWREASSQFDAYIGGIQARPTKSEEAKAKLANDLSKLNAGAATIRDVLQMHQIGSTVTLTATNGTVSHGVILDISHTGGTKNPMAGSAWKITMALTNADSRTLTIPFGQLGKNYAMTRQTGAVPVLTPEGKIEMMPIMDAFEQGGNVRREKRWIITGNLLAGTSMYPGQIVTYSKNDGTEGQGILMPRDFDFEKNKRNMKAPFTDAAKVMEFFSKVGRGATVGSPDMVLKIENMGAGQFSVLVPSSKRTGGNYFLDIKLTEAMRAEFYKAGTVMRARVYGDEAMQAGLEYLMGDGQTLVALNKQDVAREVLGIGKDTSTAEPGDAAAFSRADTFRRASPEVRAAKKAEVQSVVDQITAKWKNAPDVVVLASFDEAPDPVKAANARQVAGGAYGEPEAFVYGGKAYIVADQMKDAANVRKAVFHEVLGHRGLRGVYGSDLGQILDQLRKARARDVYLMAGRYGLDPESDRDMRVAAEEVLAVMAEQNPQLGFIRRAVAAIRSWLRRNVPAMAKMRMTDDEIINDFLLPARRFIEQGPGGPGGRKMEPAFNRPDDAGSPKFSRAAAAQYGAQARESLMDFVGKAGAQVDWLDRTFKTQYAKAQKFPEFGRVFNKLQEFIEGVSSLANQAADNAPSILPKLETWRDLAKTGLKPEDAKAVAAPIFQGTLEWARKDGKLVRVDDLVAEAADMSIDAKARQLFRDGKVTEQQLKTWKASPLDIYEGAVRNRYESEYLTGGVVFTDAELRSMFSLNDAQVKQYREFRATVDDSLDQLVAADVIRLIGKVPDNIKAMAVDPQGRKGLRKAVEELLGDKAAERQNKVADKPAKQRNKVADEDAELWNKVADKFNKVDRLKENGYAPLSRFGKFWVHVVDEEGQTLYFGMEEERSSANRLARALGEEYPGAKVEQGVMSQEFHKLMSAVPIDAMELFAEAIGADESEVFQKYIQLAKNNRSTMKRLLKRKGTAGFSQDVGRVLASFVTSNARAASSALYINDAKSLARDIKAGDVKDEAIKLITEVTEPEESGAAVRSLMFTNFIGGSIASAVVNATQPFMMTIPYLSQWGGAATAGKRMLVAMKMITGKAAQSPEIAKALKRAEDDGIVSPQEIHHLINMAAGGVGSRFPILQKAAFLWAAPFSLAEQFNRRISFVAAYLTAQEQGIKDPFAFAEKAVIETQGLYNSGNKPNVSRGVIGATAMTFKQYSIHYLEWLARMAKSGKDGKRAALLALALLMLAAGTDGLPFMEDLDDLIDTAGQAMGYDMNTERARRELIASVLGEETAEIATRGLSAAAGFPVDLSLRMGMGNLLPATDLLLKSNTDTARSLAEIAGPGGSMFIQYRDAAKMMLNGDPLDAATKALPIAGQNLAKGIEMAQEGEYRDSMGRRVMEVDPSEAVMKMVSFQPATVARESARMQENRQSENLAKQVENEIVEKWARAIVDRDRDAEKDALKMRDEWNEKNPAMPIVVKRSQAIRKARNMKMDRRDRYIKTVAPERRAQAEREME